jgi:hypothetical protein
MAPAHLSIRRRLATIGLLLLALGSGVSAGEAGSTAAEFLKLEPGARAAAMGGAGVAGVGDAFAAYFNPAITAGFRGVELAFERNEWFADLDRNYAAALVETRRFGVLGASINYLSYPEMRRTTVTSGLAGGSTGSFSASDYAVSVSWAGRFGDRFSAGVTLKGIRSEIDARRDDAFAADIGLAWRILPHWSVGASVANLGSNLTLGATGSDLPLAVRFGTSLSLLDQRLTLLLDGVQHRHEEIEAAAGAEFAIHPAVRLRAGYNSASADAGDGLSAGIGFRYSGFDLDYAYTPFDDLADAHRVSLKYRFEPMESSR